MRANGLRTIHTVASSPTDGNKRDVRVAMEQLRGLKQYRFLPIFCTTLDRELVGGTAGGHYLSPDNTHIYNRMKRARFDIFKDMPSIYSKFLDM